ncbi:bacillithiol biosynthesis deacetylase BshB1 [Paenibacillus macquariensis]|uniref:Bacillithiol biosynthesis deacetylase BshB1 n=1 Tax=Paenibacillus macquariensis TaxID=948756 RepID=A0ABY1JJH6_9BACL|nr:bacillithiol biosynthesis deacetylase BshB1 [Paenibacillus macquariensis]MEC0089730.1 bacillithiol biosynthesis deacetylase BshB1 [Paenibacillus macquariensis]OAB30792.1 bacillithiol biosynthesis deacetylase BshB1 [Paenibacillus macquariensis subsp. macquariensis]SIQ29868.1 bacillithiol biosynthesis deacetylase BshB1 [Paenibacillus macquariensis]
MTEQLDILVFGAHADDVEIGMAGTIYKHVEAGYRVGICDLTFAEMSSNGTVETRKQEAEEAGKVLKLTSRSNLGLPDRGLFMTPDNVKAVTEEIRAHAPRIIFAPYWEDRHPDHVACSKLVEEAVFNAKLRRYMPESPFVNVEQLYFYFINDLGKADLIVDISKQYDMKEKALSCYRSQFEKSESETVVTPLNQGYIERVKSRDRLVGQRRLVPFAEGFAIKSPFLVEHF